MKKPIQISKTAQKNHVEILIEESRKSNRRGKRNNKKDVFKILITDTVYF